MAGDYPFCHINIVSEEGTGEHDLRQPPRACRECHSSGVTLISELHFLTIVCPGVRFAASTSFTNSLDTFNSKERSLTRRPFLTLYECNVLRSSSNGE